jgi:hypothetical protein
MLTSADVCRRYRPYLDKVFQAVHEFWEQVSVWCLCVCESMR